MRAPFEGETLAALLAHLERDAPCVRVEALDALGAPLPRDSKETPLEDAAESIRVTAEGAFVAKIEELGGAARLETLMAGPPADLPGLKKKPAADAGWSAAAVVVSASPVTGEDDKAEGEGEKTQARAQARGRASRAHELLTLRARGRCLPPPRRKRKRKRGGDEDESAFGRFEAARPRRRLRPGVLAGRPSRRVRVPRPGQLREDFRSRPARGRRARAVAAARRTVAPYT